MTFKDLKKIFKDPDTNRILIDPNNIWKDPDKILQDPDKFWKDPGRILKDPNNIWKEPDRILQDPDKIWKDLTGSCRIFIKILARSSKILKGSCQDLARSFKILLKDLARSWEDPVRIFTRDIIYWDTQNLKRDPRSKENKLYSTKYIVNISNVLLTSFPFVVISWRAIDTIKSIGPSWICFRSIHICLYIAKAQSQFVFVRLYASRSLLT